MPGVADRCRKSGKTVPTTDLLIAACAFFRESDLEHVDAHLGLIEDAAKR